MSDKGKSASVAWKDNVGVGPLCVAVFVNSFFTVNCLVDYSMDIYARDTSNPALAVEFLKWRESGVVVSTMNTVLVMFLPLALFDMVRANLQTFLRWRTASAIRNVVDFLQLASLVGGILPTVLILVVPAQEKFVEMCSKDPGQESCAMSLEAMTQLHLVMVAFNLWMFTLDIVKFVGNSPRAVASANATSGSGSKDISKKVQ